jgi:spore coat polysaccharide biosynthesis predicted glycosyltransferase SpsG
MNLLLTEAGEGIGFGHLTRMAALGECLLNEGIDTRMLVQWEGHAQGNLLGNQSWVLNSAWRENPVSAILASQSQKVLIDSYLLKLNEFMAIIHHGIRVAVLDDFQRLDYPVDLVINPNVYADQKAYAKKFTQKVVAGSDYVILRSCILNNSKNFLVKKKLNSILVTLGGSDNHNLGIRLASGLADLGWKVTLIQPQKSDDSLNKIRILPVQNCNGMVEEILNHDLIVCGGGQTLHELAFLGVPFIPIELGDDQKFNISYYEDKIHPCDRLKWTDFNLFEKLKNRIVSLQSCEVRKNISKTLPLKIDGMGVQRIAKLIKDL